MMLSQPSEQSADIVTAGFEQSRKLSGEVGYAALPDLPALDGADVDAEVAGEGGLPARPMQGLAGSAEKIGGHSGRYQPAYPCHDTVEAIHGVVGNRLTTGPGPGDEAKRIAFVAGDLVGVAMAKPQGVVVVVLRRHDLFLPETKSECETVLAIVLVGDRGHVVVERQAGLNHEINRPPQPLLLPVNCQAEVVVGDSDFTVARQVSGRCQVDGRDLPVATAFVGYTPAGGQEAVSKLQEPGDRALHSGLLCQPIRPDRRDRDRNIATSFGGVNSYFWRISAGRITEERGMGKRKAKVIELTDLGPREARAHGEFAYEERSAREGLAIHARRMTPLERLHRRKAIEREHKDAGQRLANDWYEAGYESPTTVNLFGLRGGPGDYTPKQLAARRRFDDAMRAVGSGLADVLYTICCLEASVSDLEADMGWREGAGMVMLKTALRQLAEHYGYVAKKSLATRG